MYFGVGGDVGDEDNLDVLYIISIVSATVVILAIELVKVMDNYGYGKVLNAVNSTAAITASFYGIEAGSFGITESKEFLPSEEPVWVLGRKYSTLHELDDLLSDLRSRIWITYRSGFVPIGGSGPSSDSGWGCMLRCGQMVLAQAHMLRHLGRDWRWNRSCPNAEPDDQPLHLPDNSHELYLKVLRQFEDKKNNVYSIHQISQMGASEGKPVGTWFGPNTIAQALRKLVCYDQWNDLKLHVALDNVVIISEIKSLCLTSEPDGTANWKPLLLFIPLRLGLTDINPIYFKALKATFRLKQSLGIIGGRPNHALYFVGNVADELIYLDPHKTQSIVNVDEDDRSYHCLDVLKLDLKYLDPSISLCFYCNSESDFDTWCILVKRALIINEKQPLFELAKERMPQWSYNPVEIAQDATCLSTDTFTNYDLGSSFCQSLTTSRVNSVDSGKEAFIELDPSKLKLDDSDEDFEFLC
ncbi:Cysteine protease ATG4B [Halotydeus destructor]|nr:Cysteine protease ATG4B [Halotydeus destructor]